MSSPKMPEHLVCSSIAASAAINHTTRQGGAGGTPGRAELDRTDGPPPRRSSAHVLPAIRKALRIDGRLLFLTDVLKSFQGLIEDRFPNWSQLRRQVRWERKWARPDYKPFWRTREPQNEIVEAVKTGWLPRGDWVYDIGCGSGETSRWLSERDVRTLGLDFSPAAIDICRRLSGDDDRTRFQVIDVCAQEISLGPAAAVIDRGCFHQIPVHLRPIYLRNITRLILPGGHFLLILATKQHDGRRHNRKARSEEEIRREVEQLFACDFNIERAHPTIINSWDHGTGMAAVAFWMSRRFDVSETTLATESVQPGNQSARE